MTQGFPAQPQYGQPQQQYPPQGYAPPAPAPHQPPPASFYTQQDPAHQGQQPPPAPNYQTSPDAAPADTSSFFGGGASISWDDRKGYVIGAFRGGQIIDKKITGQTKMGTNEIIRWDNGEPRKQMEITVQTGERADPQDDGRRRIFVKGDMPRAVREALKKVSAKDVHPGGWFYAAWVSTKPATRAGYNDAKVFDVIYAPPGSPDPMAGQPAFQAQQVQQPTPQPSQQWQQPPAQFAPQAPQQGQFGAQPPVPQHAAQAAPQPPAAPAGVPADQAAQFAAWQAQQAGAAQAPTQSAPAPDGQPQQWNPYG